MNTNMQQKVAIPIQTHTWEAILNYLISVRVINRRFIHNIIQLIHTIDTRPYARDDYDVFLIKSIAFVAKVREDGVNNLNYIKTSIEQSDLDQNYVAQLYQNLAMTTEDMSKEEYDNLIELVSLYVDYGFIYYSWPLIVKAHDALINGNGRITINEIQKIKELYESTLSKIRVSDTTRNTENTLCIGQGSKKELKNEISQLYDTLTDPSNILVTGLKELNRFLNGGYRRKRMYIYYAPTNSFKSGILLYNALWIMTFNPEIKPKFPNKKLAILMITMENTVEETMDRIHAIYTAGQVDPRNITKDEYLKQWDNIFENLNTNFKLYIRYKQPGTTSVGIMTEVQEIEEDDNVEIAAVIIDHLGNMGKLDKNVDDRKGLINTTYELSDWAKQTDRTIITAMHTNSSFDEIRAEAEQNGKTNIVRSMGRHCIADAKYIDRAVDQSIYMLKERSNIDGKWYLGFKYEKVRTKKSNGSNVFYHLLENEITLRYDQGLSGCNSYPCIPGTENSIQMAQAEANGIQQMTAGITPQTSLPPPMPKNPPMAFGNSMGGGMGFGNKSNQFQAAIQNKMNQPMEMTINQGESFNIETAGIIQQVPQSFDNSRLSLLLDDNDSYSSDYSSQDFSNDDDENFNDYLGSLYANPDNFNSSGINQSDDSDEDYDTNEFAESEDDVSIYVDGD